MRSRAFSSGPHAAGALIFLLALLIKQVPLRGRAQAGGEAASPQPELVS